MQIQFYKSSFENKSKYRELLEKKSSKAAVENTFSFSGKVNLVLVIDNLLKVGRCGEESLRLNCFSMSLQCGPEERVALHPPLCRKVACFGSQKDVWKHGHPCSDTSEYGKETECSSFEEDFPCYARALQSITCFQYS